MEDVRVKKRAVVDRFNEKVNWSSGPCWEWMGSRDRRSGYGQISVAGKVLKAHRVSWELHRGPVPGSLCVLHACDNPRCVRPSHLFLGTQLENIADREAKGRNRPLQGSDNGYSKLTEADVRTIRASRATQEALAYLYGVAQTTISSIRRRKTWRHVS
jgi:hypothetical protein